MRQQLFLLWFWQQLSLGQSIISFLKVGDAHLQTLVFILIIAALVQIVETFIKTHG